MLKRPDHGFGLKDPMPYGRIDEGVFFYLDYGTTMKSQWKTDIIEVSKYDL